MAIKCGETITLAYTVKSDASYSTDVKIYDPSGQLVDTLTSFSLQQQDDGRYKVIFLYTLPSDCTKGIWKADITVRFTSDTCQKETLKFYVSNE